MIPIKEFDFVDIQELSLYYKLKKNIPFDTENGTLVTYLEELKEFDKKFVSTSTKFAKKLGYFLILLLFGVFSIFFYIVALNDILKVFQNTYLITENNYWLILGIPELFIPPISIFSYILAGSIMLLAEIFFILAYIVGVYKNWTDYHEELYRLVKKLREMDLLEEFFILHKETQSFHLKKMSINWEMEWVYPFIFNTFPPYFHEMGEISIYIFSLISLPLPILVSIATLNKNLIFLPILLGIALFLFVMAFWRSRKLIQTYRSFKIIQKILIKRQQDKLLHLLFQENVDQLLIHLNRENLYRLASERSIPTSFPLVPLSILLSIFSAIIGYVILALENA
jgi:hypothetical protein